MRTEQNTQRNDLLKAISSRHFTIAEYQPKAQYLKQLESRKEESLELNLSYLRPELTGELLWSAFCRVVFLGQEANFDCVQSFCAQD